MKKLNWKAKLAVAALAVSAAMPASAALTGSAGGNSSLMLTVWDSANSYTRDLGTTLDGFLAAAGGTIDSSAILNFGGDSLFTTLFGTNATNLSWNIVAADSTYAANLDAARLLVTGSLGLAPTGTRNAVLLTGGPAVTTQANTMNGAGCSTASSCSVAATAPGSGALGTWGGNVGGGTTIPTVGGVGSQLGMYLLTALNSSGAATTASVTPSTFSANGQQSYWTLNAATGAVTWNVASVPVPAAIWLLGSGLLGLIGVGRRKAVTAA